MNRQEKETLKADLEAIITALEQEGGVDDLTQMFFKITRAVQDSARGNGKYERQIDIGGAEKMN